MREIVLDTETTGLSPADGDRLIEIACVELEDHRPTGRTFHRFVNPERDVPPAATKIHGITNLFLRDKPKFAAIASELDAFLAGASIVAHNAPFDAAFVNAEFKRLDHPGIDWRRWIDTNTMAQRKFGRGKGKTTLDALCNRFSIDRKGRVRHGAMADTELLVEVYLALADLNQGTLDLQPPKKAEVIRLARNRPVRSVCTAQPSEVEAWSAFVATIGDSIWTQYLEPQRAAA